MIHPSNIASENAFRLLVEDVTLIGGEMIQVHVRLRAGTTRSFTLAKPLPIAQIRKTK
jgi:hypothetical protein